MECTTRIEADSYDFFDNINDYIKYSDNVVHDRSLLNSDDNCYTFSQMHAESNTTEGKKICELFIKLYKYFPNIRTNTVGDTNNRKHWNFLNYWLNFKLNENKLKISKCVHDFYKGMEDHCTETLFPFFNSTNLIYNINEEDLRRMEILYILYKNYNKLDTIINNVTPQEPKSLLEPSRTCSNNYKIGRSMCYGKYNKFCEKLKDFKTKYENLYKTAESKGDQYTNNFKKLTDYENSNIISSTVIGSAAGLIPLFGILYKFTPIGQIFNTQKSKLPKDHSNSIDEIRRTSLLEYENERLILNQEKYNIEYHPA